MSTLINQAETQWTIYKISNTINDKVYIGLTKLDIQVRLCRHFNRAVSKSKEPKTHLFRAILKYGKEAFYIEPIVSYISTKEEACELEKLYIEKYNSYYKGYNSTFGGEGISGYTHTKEMQKLIAEKCRLFYCNMTAEEKAELSLKRKLAAANMDKKFISELRKNLYANSTAEYKFKYSKIRTEGNRSRYNSVKYWFYHPEYGSDFMYITEFAKKYNIKPYGFYLILKGKNKTATGWTILTMTKS